MPYMVIVETVNSIEPDHMLWMPWLAWLYTCDRGFTKFVLAVKDRGCNIMTVVEAMIKGNKMSFDLQYLSNYFIKSYTLVLKTIVWLVELFLLYEVCSKHLHVKVLSYIYLLKHFR